MRFAISGSLLMHGGAAALVMGFATLTPPPPPAASDVVSIDIIATHSFSTNATEVIQSDATVTAISAGGKPVEVASLTPLKPDALLPKSLEPIAPNTAAEVEPTAQKEIKPFASKRQPDAAKPIEPQAAINVLSARTNRVNPQAALTPEPIALAALKSTAALAVPTQDVQATPVPVPLPRLANRPEHKEPVRAKTTKKKTAKKPRKTEKSKQAKKAKTRKDKAKTASRGGNGGASSADSRASAARSAAAVSNYPGKIISKLRRALRFPKGTRKSGEVRVQFKVAQNGRASSIRIVRSSGDKRLDAAAIATVKRAAPFPPIPQKAGRRSWTFTVPLAFRR